MARAREVGMEVWHVGGLWLLCLLKSNSGVEFKMKLRCCKSLFEAGDYLRWSCLRFKVRMWVSRAVLYVTLGRAK